MEGLEGGWRRKAIYTWSTVCAHIAWQRGLWERGGGEGVGQVAVEG